MENEILQKLDIVTPETPDSWNRLSPSQQGLILEMRAFNDLLRQTIELQTKFNAIGWSVVDTLKSQNAARTVLYATPPADNHEHLPHIPLAESAQLFEKE